MSTCIAYIQALAEKEKGNSAYKKKNFVVALEHYTKASELDPTDMTYLTNLAAVYFEQKELTKCIEMCTRAIEVGRENRADFKLIAKAYTRIGNAYKKLKVCHYFIKQNFRLYFVLLLSLVIQGFQQCKAKLRKVSFRVSFSRDENFAI